MQVGWLQDDPGYVGGAERTMAEFRDAAPVEVTVIGCPPGKVVQGLDRYVVGNCMTYALKDRPDGKVLRYHHDHGRSLLDSALSAVHVFTSPSHYDRIRFTVTNPVEVIPPAIDLEPFRAVASSNHRQGNVCVGRMAYGKGLELLEEYDEPVDVYSTVPVASRGSVRYRGAASDVAQTLSRYETFVFLPSALEPFGRAVVEAWAAGLDLVVNGNVGSLYWIRHDPKALDHAAEDFWKLVLA